MSKEEAIERDRSLHQDYHSEHISHHENLQSEFETPAADLQSKLTIVNRLEHRLKSLDVLKTLEPYDLVEFLLDLGCLCQNQDETKLTPHRNDEILDPPWLPVERYTGNVNLIHRKNPSVHSRVFEIAGEVLSQLAADLLSCLRKEISVADLAVYADRLQDIEDDKASMDETSLRARVADLRKQNGQLDRRNLFLSRKNKGLLKRIQAISSQSKAPHQGQTIDQFDRKMKTFDHQHEYGDRQSESNDCDFLSFGDENEK
jgi:hypothetical protein